MADVHIGLIGAGNISETHAAAAGAIEGVRIAAVCGRTREKAERLAVRCGAAAYSDLERFLQHVPLDLVVIGSPSGLHAEQGIAAARRGLHVLVEKPIDVSTAGADRLIAEAARAGVTLGVIFQDRMKPGVARLKAIVDSGRLGTPILVSARVRWHRPPEYYAASTWRGTQALDGGGALMNQAVHTVDLLLWLFGPVRRVFGKVATRLHAIQVEDTAVAALEFASGALGTIEAATSSYPRARHRSPPRRRSWRTRRRIVRCSRISSPRSRAGQPRAATVRKAGRASRSSKRSTARRVRTSRWSWRLLTTR